MTSRSVWVALATIALVVALQLGTSSHVAAGPNSITHITDCGIFKGPGTFLLDNDLNPTPSLLVACLTFKGHGVNVDLQGHTVACNPSAPQNYPNANHDAIDLVGHGTVLTSTGGSGRLINCYAALDVDGQGGNVISNLEITMNCDGVHLESGNNTLSASNVHDNACNQAIIIRGDHNTVDGNNVSNNCAGITVDSGGSVKDGSTITNNTVNSNGLFTCNTSAPVGRGIWIVNELNGLQTFNVVQSNTALGNTLWDLSDDNPACDNNTWSGNVFGSANQSCIH